MRILYAFLFAPALLPAALLGYLYFAGGPAAPISPENVLGTVLPLSYVTMFVIGLPSYLLVRLLQATSFSGHLIWGLCIAAIAQFAYLDSLVANWRIWWASVGGELSAAPVHTFDVDVVWWGYGAAMGGLFWLVARPDLLNQPARMTRPLFDGIHRGVP